MFIINMYVCPFVSRELKLSWKLEKYPTDLSFYVVCGLQKCFICVYDTLALKISFNYIQYSNIPQPFTALKMLIKTTTELQILQYSKCFVGIYFF